MNILQNKNINNAQFIKNVKGKNGANKTLDLLKEKEMKKKKMK